MSDKGVPMKYRATATVTITRTYEVEIEIEVEDDSGERRVPRDVIEGMVESDIEGRVAWTDTSVGFEDVKGLTFEDIDEPQVEIEIHEILNCEEE